METGRGDRTPLHTRVVLLMGLGSSVAAVGSVVFAFFLRREAVNVDPLWGQLLVATWVLVPPLWFLIEWALFSDQLSAYGRDRLKHMHDLARNFWVGLVTVLAAVLQLGPFQG